MGFIKNLINRYRHRHSTLCCCLALPVDELYNFPRLFDEQMTDVMFVGAIIEPQRRIDKLYTYLLFVNPDDREKARLKLLDKFTVEVVPDLIPVSNRVVKKCLKNHNKKAVLEV